MCQARPHPTLSLTLIVVGEPRSEGQEATAACQPQNTASSFSGLVAYRDPGFQFHGHTRSPLGLNTSLSVERVRRPLFSRLFHEYRSWGPLADPHSVASAGVRPQCGSKTILPSTRNNKKQCCQRHMPLPPPNHRDSGWQFPWLLGEATTCHTHALLRPRLDRGTSPTVSWCGGSRGLGSWPPPPSTDSGSQNLGVFLPAFLITTPR